MPRKPSLKGAALPPKAAESHPLYSDATSAVFRSVLSAIEGKLPARHAGLLELFEAGGLHDANAVEAALNGGAT